MKCIYLATIVFIFFTLPVYAAAPGLPATQASLLALQAGDVVINEIMYNLEAADDPHEWVELFNISSQSVDLTDWRFNDGKNHILNIPPEKSGQGSIVIQPYEYVIFADDAETFLADHPGFSKTVIDTVISLKNTSATLLLSDAGGNIIDSITYQNTWGADGNGKSLEKINASGNDDSDNWQESSSAGGTPGSQNSTYEPVLPLPEPEPDPAPDQLPPADEPDQQADDPLEIEPDATTTDNGEETPQQITYPDSIFINEIMPYPIGSDRDEEWIEILNENNKQVDISLWQIRDISGAINTYTFPEGTNIATNAFLVISRPTTKITLNNDSDGLEFIRPDEEIIQTIQFGKARKGESYAMSDEAWQWSDVPTPGSANIIQSIYSKKNTDSTTPRESESATNRRTNAEPYAEQTQNFDSVQRSDNNLASIGSSRLSFRSLGEGGELGVNDKNSNLVIYFLAPLLAMLSAIFIFLLKKRLQTMK